MAKIFIFLSLFFTLSVLPVQGATDDDWWYTNYTAGQRVSGGTASASVATSPTPRASAQASSTTSNNNPSTLPVTGVWEDTMAFLAGGLFLLGGGVLLRYSRQG